METTANGCEATAGDARVVAMRIKARREEDRLRLEAPHSRQKLIAPCASEGAGACIGRERCVDAIAVIALTPGGLARARKIWRLVRGDVQPAGVGKADVGVAVTMVHLVTHARGLEQWASQSGEGQQRQQGAEGHSPGFQGSSSRVPVQGASPGFEPRRSARQSPKSPRA